MFSLRLIGEYIFKEYAAQYYLWTGEWWQGHWAAWHGCKEAPELSTRWVRKGREGKTTLWFSLILNLACLFNCTVGCRSDCKKNDGESIFVPWFHHIPCHFSHLSQLPKWFIQHGLLLIHHLWEQRRNMATDRYECLFSLIITFSRTTGLSVVLGCSSEQSQWLVPSFLRLCYWLCRVWWL